MVVNKYFIYLPAHAEKGFPLRRRPNSLLFLWPFVL